MINRREFLKRAYQLGGIAALSNLGVSLAEASNIINPYRFASGGSVSYIFRETFNSVSPDETWNAWDSGTEITYDCDASPCPIYDTGQSASGVGSVSSYSTYTANDEVYLSTVFRFAALPSADTDFFYVQNGQYTQLAIAKFRTSGLIRVTSGGQEINGPTLSAATTYYLLIRYKLGTGANGECDFWVDTDGSFDGTKYSTTSSTATAQASAVRLNNTTASATTIYWDEIRGATSAFTY